MMTLSFSPSAVEFCLGPLVAGCYRHADEFKPFIHPLRTPRGHSVTLAGPWDHKHHKGLQYALRIEGMNFWEEFSTLPDEQVGRQRHLDFSEVTGSGETVGFAERLGWEGAGGGEAVFEEKRWISCRHAPERRAFIWKWKTEILPLRDVTLIQSQWSHALSGGSKVNYHGLGIRFRRDMGGLTRGNKLILDGNEVDKDFMDHMGECPNEVTYIGNLDETWPVERAGVTFKQNQNNALYICSDVFPFMALGPSNARPRKLFAGKRLSEEYTITVCDVPW